MQLQKMGLSGETAFGTSEKVHRWLSQVKRDPGSPLAPARVLVVPTDEERRGGKYPATPIPEIESAKIVSSRHESISRNAL